MVSVRRARPAALAILTPMHRRTEEVSIAAVHRPAPRERVAALRVVEAPRQRSQRMRLAPPATYRAVAI